MLKDGRKRYVKVGDIVSYVHIISSCTTMPDEAKMEAIFAKFKELKKSNVEEIEK